MLVVVSFAVVVAVIAVVVVGESSVVTCASAVSVNMVVVF